MNDEKILLDKVLEDMCFHEIAWVQNAAQTYFHEEYLHEKKFENHERKWWQFWKPRFVWKKVQ